MTDLLRDKVVVIIGGTSGLGLSACRACVRSGARVVVLGHSPQELRAVEVDFGNTVRTVLGDACQAAAAGSAVRTAAEAYGRVDGLYHVAGGSGRGWGDGPVHQIPDRAWEETIRWNLTSVFYSNRAAVTAFLEQGQGGVIINMASVTAFSPSPRYFSTHAYAAAKAAIVGLTKASAAYYAGWNIRINAVAPGLTDTPMASRAAKDPAILEYIRYKQPLDGGRMGRTADLDGLVVYLLSDESRFMTGQVLVVDGGWSVSDGCLKREAAEVDPPVGGDT